jgi:hypothetical protein
MVRATGSRGVTCVAASVGIALVTTLGCGDTGTASRTSGPAGPAALVNWSLAKAPGNNGDLQRDTVLTLITPLQVVVRANDTAAAGVKVLWKVSMNGVDVGTVASITDHTGIAAFQFSLGPQAGAFVIVAMLEPGFNAEAATFNLAATPGHPAALIAVSGADQSDTATAELKSEYVARVIDGHGNGVSGVEIHWEVTAGGGSISSASGTTSASDGQARAKHTLGRLAGLNVVTATAQGVDVPISFSASATAAHPTQLTIVSGNDQTAATDQTLVADDVVRVTDNYGNAVAGVLIEWAITNGGGSLSATHSLTAADGSAATRSTLGGAAGTQTVMATASGLPSAPHVNFSATATAPP